MRLPGSLDYKAAMDFSDLATRAWEREHFAITGRYIVSPFTEQDIIDVTNFGDDGVDSRLFPIDTGEVVFPPPPFPTPGRFFQIPSAIEELFHIQGLSKQSGEPTGEYMGDICRAPAGALQISCFPRTTSFH